MRYEILYCCEVKYTNKFCSTMVTDAPTLSKLAYGFCVGKVCTRSLNYKNQLCLGL